MRHNVIAATALLLALYACERSQPVGQNKKVTAQESARRAVEVIETAWPKEVAERTEKLVNAGKLKYSLPELRVYNAERKLIYHAVGAQPGKTAQSIDAAIAVNRPIPGPSFKSTFADLETRDQRPAREIVHGQGKTTIIDYWADWCVPCKALEKELMAWAATQSGNDVQIVRAETDLMKLSLARGEKVIMMTKDANGKLIRKEIN